MSHEDRFHEVKHDLRNHINTISVNVQLIKLLIQRESVPDKAFNSLDVILSECQACANILNGDERV